MQIPSGSYLLSGIQANKTGNELPQKNATETPSVPAGTFKQAMSLSASAAATQDPRAGSSIEALEAYFAEKMAGLKAAGHDTTQLSALRDSIREAAADTSGNAPALPTVIEHPYGGKTLGNVHLSFGSEVKGEPQDMNGQQNLLHRLRLSV